MGSAAFRVCSLLVALALSTPAFAQPTINALRANIGPSGSICTIHSGTGAPSTSLGAVCDTYMRKDSPYTVYYKTGASTWTALIGMPASATAGDVITAASSSALGRVAAVATGQVLASAGTGTPPAYTASPSLTSIGGAANLTINPAGDVVFNPTGNDILPTTGYDLNIGSLTTKYLTLHVAEMWAETLVAQNTIATIGGRILVGPTTTLTTDLAAAGTTITVKHNQIANGDRLYMEADGKVEFMAVTSGAGGSAGAYTYTVTRNLDGSGANDWFAGDAVFNTGTTNDGYIDLYSVSGVNSGSTAGPTIVGNVRTGTTYSNLAPRWAIGNLNGLYGYGVDTYGAAFGDFSNSYLTVDATNGIRMIGDAGTMFSMDTAGNATFAGRITVGTGRNLIANSEFMRGRGTGDGYDNYWGGSPATGDVGGTYTCTTGSCTQRIVYGGSWSWVGVDENTASTSLTISLATSSAEAPLGGSSVTFRLTGTPANTTYTRFSGPIYPIDEDLQYEYSAYVGMSGSWSTRARIIWYGVDGGDAGNQPDLLSEVDGATVCTSGTYGTDIGTWCRVGGIFTPPAGARLAQLAIVSVYDGGDAAPITVMTRPFFAQANTGQTALSPWGPGGQTLITGDMLSNDLIITNTLRSADATSLTAGTGYWLSAVGTPVFRVGNPSGNQVKWDGTNLTITSQNVTMDSNGIYIGGLTDVNSYVDTRDFGFDVATGSLGFGATDGATYGRVSRTHSEWTGDCTPGTNRCAASVSIDARSNDNGVANTGATSTLALVTQAGNTNDGLAFAQLTLSHKNNTDYGQFIQYAYPDYRAGTQTTIGAAGAASAPNTPVGYVKIFVNGTAYIMPYYNR